MHKGEEGEKVHRRENLEIVNHQVINCTVYVVLMSNSQGNKYIGYIGFWAQFMFECSRTISFQNSSLLHLRIYSFWPHMNHFLAAEMIFFDNFSYFPMFSGKYPTLRWPPPYWTRPFFSLL